MGASEESGQPIRPEAGLREHGVRRYGIGILQIDALLHAGQDVVPHLRDRRHHPQHDHRRDRSEREQREAASAGPVGEHREEALQGSAQGRQRRTLSRADIQCERCRGRREQQRQHQAEQACRAGRPPRPATIGSGSPGTGFGLADRDHAEPSGPLCGVSDAEGEDDRVEDACEHADDPAGGAGTAEVRRRPDHAAPGVRLACNAVGNVTALAWPAGRPLGGERGCGRLPERAERVTCGQFDAVQRQIQKRGRGRVVHAVHPQLEHARPCACGSPPAAVVPIGSVMASPTVARSPWPSC